MSGGPPGGMPGGNFPGAGGTVVMTARPDAYSDWTDQNFLDAVREQDPRVLEAIDDRVNSAPGDQAVAELLASLFGVSTVSTGTVSTGSGYPGQGNAGRSYPGAGGLPGAPPNGTAPPASPPAEPPRRKKSLSGGSGAGAAGGAAPQTRITIPRPRSIAVDSLSVMLAESVTAYVPQGAGVGALAGGNVVGRRLGGQQGAGPPDGESGSDSSGEIPDDGLAGTAGEGYPGGFPGGNPGASAGVGNGEIGRASCRERV